VNAATGYSNVIEFQAGLSGAIATQFGSSSLPPIKTPFLRITGSGRDLVNLDLSSFQVLKLAAINGGLFALEDINVVNGVGNRGGCLNSEFGAVLLLNRVCFADCIALASGAMAAEGGAI